MSENDGGGGKKRKKAEDDLSELGLVYTGAFKTKQHWEVIAMRIENGGIPMQVTTAEELWDRAKSYFKWVDENPIVNEDVLRAGMSAGRIIHFNTPRPYSLSSYCLHANVDEQYIYDCAKSNNKDEFFFVANTILRIIKTQILEYTVSGVFNATIGAKIIGLNTETKPEGNSMQINIEVIGNAPQLLTSESNIKIERETQKYEIGNISDDSGEAPNEQS